MIVVCYLEGLSHAQAAHHLHLAESTIRGRLCGPESYLADG